MPGRMSMMALSAMVIVTHAHLRVGSTGFFVASDSVDARLTSNLAKSTVEHCLQGKEIPPDECSPKWNGKGCGSASIPAWAATYDLVVACFRCCIETLFDLPELKRKRDFWTDELQHSVVGPKHGIPASIATQVLLGHNSDLLLADAGKTYDGRKIKEVRARQDGSIDPKTFRFLSTQGDVDFGELRAQLRVIGDRGERLNLFTMGDGRYPQEDQNDILDSEQLLFWFVNNRAINHPKVITYPRGIYSVDRWAKHLKGEKRQTMKENRPGLLMCDCMTLKYGRQEDIAKLRKNGFDCHSNCTNYVDEMLSHRFVASPHGNGQNNHREWEALCAGAVPIVDFDEYSQDIWNELPVIQVRDWSVVTPAFLASEWIRIQNATYDLRKAYFPYWAMKLLNLED